MQSMPYKVVSPSYPKLELPLKNRRQFSRIGWQLGFPLGWWLWQPTVHHPLENNRSYKLEKMSDQKEAFWRTLGITLYFLKKYLGIIFSLPFDDTQYADYHPILPNREESPA
jgi:hypothetical protein